MQGLLSGQDVHIGTVDAHQDGGVSARLEFALAEKHVAVPRVSELENRSRIGALRLVPEVQFETASGEFAGSEDEDVNRCDRRVSDALFLGGILEYERARESGFELGDASNQDRVRQRLSPLVQLTWRPSDRFHLLASPRFDAKELDGVRVVRK